MRRAIGLACALSACARPTVAPPAAPPPPATPAPIAEAAIPPAPPPFAALPSLETLGERAPLLAAGMRAVASGELSSPPSSPPAPATCLLVHADDADTCVRIALVAQPPIHAWVTDGRDDILADVSSVTDSPIGLRGPVCVRKGDAVTLHLSGEGVWAARYAAWASP